MRPARFAAALSAACALAWSSSAFAAPTVNVTGPAPNSVQNIVLQVHVKTTPVTYPVSKVTADLNGTIVNLVYSASTSTWDGEFPIKNLAFGPHDVVVTAYDTAPSQTVVTIPFIHDEIPVVTNVIAPRRVFEPASIPLKVNCTDDDPGGCSSLIVTLDPYSGPPVVLATSSSSIDTVFDLSAYVGQDVSLLWEARDSRNHVVKRGSSFRVTSTPPPVCQLFAPPDPRYIEKVIDIDDDRALISGGRIIDRRTMQEVAIPIPVDAAAFGAQGLLIPEGALLGYGSGNGLGPAKLFLWRNGTPAIGAPLDVRAFTDRFVVSNHFVCGTTDLLTAAAGVLPACAPTTTFMSSTGSACATAIPFDADIQVHSSACDNGNVVYEFSTKSIPGTNHRGLRLADKNNNITDLVTERINFDAQPRVYDQSRDSAYEVVGDWVAFTYIDGTGVRQLYRRDPGGVVSPVSQVPTNSITPRLVAMSPSGELLLNASVGTSFWGLHRVPAGATVSAATFVASNLDQSATPWRAIARDDHWHLFTAGGAYEFNDGASKPFDCPAPPPVALDGGVDGAADAASNTDGGASSSSSSGASSSSSSGASSTSSGGSSSSSTSGAAGDGGTSGATDGEGSSCSTASRSGSGSAFALALSALTLALSTRRRRTS